MEKYTQVLEIMFRHVSVKEILKRNISFSKFGKGTFVLLANSYIPQYSNTEIENLYDFLEEDMWNQKKKLFGQHMGVVRDKMFREDISAFDVLLGFAEHVLMEMGNVPVCCYNRLLRWRITSHKLGEDLFVSAFLAYRDLFQAGYRRDLRWKLVIGTNNVSLQQIMERGIAENHFHLKGSAPYFHLSWISMMNDMDNPAFEKILRSYDNRRMQGKYNYNPTYGEDSLSMMQKQAALIRLVLFMKLSGRRFVLGNYGVDAEKVKDYLDYDRMGKYIWEKEEIEKHISGRYSAYKRLSFAAAFSYNSENRVLDDYARAILSDILEGLWFNIDSISRMGEEISLAEIVEGALESAKKISLKNLQLFVSEKDYQKLEETYNLKYIYHILEQPDLLETNRREIQNLILVQRWEQSRLSGCSDITDYAIPPEYSCEYSLQESENDEGTHIMAEEARNILTGERWILYQMFLRYFNKDKEMWPYMNLFYAYLVIKENIRSELIQVNENVGFSNFSYYEARKEDFIEGTVFEKHFLRIAIWDIIKKGNIKSLEARITPKRSKTEDIRSILKYDRLMDLSREEKNTVFYVYHFVKEKEKRTEIESDILCHHDSLRKKVKQQALAFAKMRELYPDISNRVLGIDACNAEIVCRPEVFSQAFRFLRNHTVREQEFTPAGSEKKVPVLGVTYHVGEDFLDVIDGLRAIDEACHFLNLKCGDRLGHALALGIDVREWYQGKGRRVLVSKQAYLDNLVWMFTKIREIGMVGYEDLLLYIEKEYWKFFHEIYLNHISDCYVDSVLKKKREYYRASECNEPGRFNQFDITIYYDAWKLRGDAPECYQDGFYRPMPMLDYSWEHYQVNREGVEENKIRYDFETAFLYHTYHYNKAVKLEGSKSIEVKVSDKMIQAVTMVQKYMQQEIALKGISIETNPSSNYLIGTFKRYDKHPILKFYNMGLTLDHEELRECPQIVSSINTDDQGVFATSLENEYALMILALERMRDSDGNLKYSRERIYKWVDDIREMGIRQSFLRNKRER